MVAFVSWLPPSLARGLLLARAVVLGATSGGIGGRRLVRVTGVLPYFLAELLHQFEEFGDLLLELRVARRQSGIRRFELCYEYLHIQRTR